MYRRCARLVFSDVESLKTNDRSLAAGFAGAAFTARPLMRPFAKAARLKAWPPPEGSEIRSLSKRFSCHICHTFCEEGEGFCGYHVYSSGEYIDSASDDIEWSDDLDEYGYAEVVGPEYVLGNVPDYGG